MVFVPDYRWKCCDAPIYIGSNLAVDVIYDLRSRDHYVHCAFVFIPDSKYRGFCRGTDEGN